MAKKRAKGGNETGHTAEVEGRDLNLLIEEARRAASNCLHAVSRFIVASGQPLAGPEYRATIQEELDAYIARRPYDVLMQPLLDAIGEYPERIRPVRAVLPDYDNGTESREFHPWSESYHELAYAIASELHRGIQAHDPDMIASGIQRQPTTEEWQESLSDAAPIVPSPYSTISSYQLAPTHRFVTETFRFCRLNYEDIRARLWNESRQIPRHGLARTNPARQSVHDPNIDPPATHRRRGEASGDPIGPLTGEITELGFALHRKDCLTPKAYQDQFHRSCENGTIWARWAQSGGLVEAYLKATSRSDDDFKQLLKLKTRLTAYPPERSQTK